jgi:hypothetical protein
MYDFLGRTTCATCFYIQVLNNLLPVSISSQQPFLGLVNTLIPKVRHRLQKKAGLFNPTLRDEIIKENHNNLYNHCWYRN